MTTLWETQTLDDLQAEEARKHNAMIRERYRLLQNAEEAQLEKTFAEAEQQKRAEQFTAPAAPVEPVVPAVPEAPAAPVVKTQERAVPLTAQQKDLFTADTFRRVVSGAAEAQAAVQTPVQAPAFRPVYVPGEAKEQVKAVEKSAGKLLAYQCFERRNCRGGGVCGAADCFNRREHPHLKRKGRRAYDAGREKSGACGAKQRACKPHRKSYQRRNHRRMGASQRLDEIKEIRYKIK